MREREMQEEKRVTLPEDLHFRTVLLEYYQIHLFLCDPGTYRTTLKTDDLLFVQYSDGGAPIW